MRIKFKTVASETEKPPETKEMSINAVEEVKDAEVDAVCEQRDAEVNAVSEVQDAEVSAVFRLLDKESTTADLMHPAVDKEIVAAEMKADLREFSDWMVDADCQTDEEERTEVALVENSVNTEVPDVSDGAVQVEYFAADKAVGPEVEFELRCVDAVTSMESSVFSVDNFNDAEKVSATLKVLTGLIQTLRVQEHLRYEF